MQRLKALLCGVASGRGTGGRGTVTAGITSVPADTPHLVVLQERSADPSSGTIAMACTTGWWLLSGHGLNCKEEQQRPKPP